MSEKERKPNPDEAPGDASVRLAAAGSGVGVGGRGHLALASATPLTVEGRVTQGAMTRDRLTSEAMEGVTAGIRNLTPRGGGEIRIRLNPRNLGELHLRVVTDGSQVNLRIQASDEKARKILEESIGSLSESLARHQLHLGPVDFTVSGLAQGHEGGLPGDSGRQQSRHGQEAALFQGQLEGRMDHPGHNGRGGWGTGGEGDRDGFGQRVGQRVAQGIGPGRSPSSGAIPSRRIPGFGDGRRLDVKA